MAKLSVKDVPVQGKRVLVRVDFNVPLDENQVITDESRIVGALPTIKYLLENNAKIILCSHLGRPKGKFVPEMSLAPVAKRLRELLPETNIIFANDVIGEDARKKASELKEGEILLLENLRFHAEEEKNDPEFAKALASFAVLYVSEAFGTVHRAHASTEGVAHYLPAVCGFLIEKELSFMGKALADPDRPFVALLGGKKVGDKIGVIRNLLDKCDTLLIGGGMSYTFYKAMGCNIGTSVLDEASIDLASSLLEEAKAKGVELMLPVDCVIGKDFCNDTEIRTVAYDAIPDGYMGMDIGPATIEKYASIIREAGTVVWNGPFGVFEFDNFAHGISTGGGASLEFLEGKTLPGVACLMDKPVRRKLIAGNWKMNMNRDEAKELISELIPLVTDADCDIVICPPFVDLCCAAKKLQGTNIHLGSQNIHWAAKGAFTGEISADMLKNIGVEYAIIGHSERRQYFGETDETVNMRVKAALENGILPIVCVGETLDQREAGITDTFLASQVRALYQGIEKEAAERIVIAYEPIWAIGTGKTATDEEANRTIGAIRKNKTELYGFEFARHTRILYGGSMNAKNAAGLKSMPEIDGGLIGGASLKAEDFAKVIKA